MGTREGTEFERAIEAALAGGPERHHQKTAEQGKLGGPRAGRAPGRSGVVRRGGRCWRTGTRRASAPTGWSPGSALIGGRKVCLMANDPTVKAGSWGPKTVEKILRIQERALSLELPMIYLVDSAGARITEQVQMFPGRRGAGRIFYNEVKLSGRVPQVCLLFGPSAAGGAYIPAFCDVVIMREGNASMYLGSPRMAEMVIGEKVTLEEMGGAKMHTGVSGCGHFLVGPTRRRSTSPGATSPTCRRTGASARRRRLRPSPRRTWPYREIVPDDEKTAFDIKELIGAVVDAGSFCEVHARWAKELVVGYARLDGRAIGIVANQPKYKGGVLFVDSADKAARFIATCNAFNIPLLFLADVPGFMIGTEVERQGIIRHGAKMISAVSEATVPKLSVIVRKAYGAGLYAMAGPGLRARLLHRPADGVDRGHGARGGDQRRLLQPDPGDRGRRRARALRAREARGVLGRHRHPPPRLRAGGRRGDRSRRPARRADPPLRARRAIATAASPSAATRSRRPSSERPSVVGRDLDAAQVDRAAGAHLALRR